MVPNQRATGAYILPYTKFLAMYLPCSFVSQRVWSSTKRKKRFATASDHVFFPGPRLQTLSRALMASLTTLVLLVPVVLLNSLSTMVGRFVTIIIAAGVFVFANFFITKAKTSEIFLASAA